jgi:hypothetical protein
MKSKKSYSSGCLAIIIIVVILIHPAFSIVLGTEETTHSEYHIKAGYLYNFTKFVEWPAETMLRHSTFTLAVLGRNPFGNAIKALEGKPVQNRKLLIIYINSAREAKDCDMLFISAFEQGNMNDIITSLGSSHGILTISDADHFLQAGGIIGFVNVHGKVRFEVNYRAARQAKLQISSHLLRLATRVIE